MTHSEYIQRTAVRKIARYWEIVCGVVSDLVIVDIGQLASGYGAVEGSVTMDVRRYASITPLQFHRSSQNGQQHSAYSEEVGEDRCKFHVESFFVSLREVGLYVVGLETSSKEETIALGLLLYHTFSQDASDDPKKSRESPCQLGPSKRIYRGLRRCSVHI